ncbi:hypothetical protein BH23VER1_BH23VER1_04720 [soil metagenome]
MLDLLRQKIGLPAVARFGTLVAGAALASCAAPKADLVVSVKDQRMLVVKEGVPVATYPVSTSKFGVGTGKGTYKTPLGKLEIAEKIGCGSPPGTVFKSRRRTGEILPVDAPGRDPIVTRILWLRGKERHNADTYGRYIYIHGTPEERNIGQPASYGCIRMRSRDVIDLYDRVGEGSEVLISTASLPRAAKPLVRAEYAAAAVAAEKAQQHAQAVAAQQLAQQAAQQLAPHDPQPTPQPLVAASAPTAPKDRPARRLFRSAAATAMQPQPPAARQDWHVSRSEAKDLLASQNGRQNGR